jgi:hypothetical protein
MIIEAISPAIASVAPILCATVGMIGIIAPSPVEKSSVGRNAGSAIELHLKGSSSVLIALYDTRAPEPGHNRRLG